MPSSLHLGFFSEHIQEAQLSAKRACSSFVQIPELGRSEGSRVFVVARMSPEGLGLLCCSYQLESLPLREGYLPRGWGKGNWRRSSARSGKERCLPVERLRGWEWAPGQVALGFSSLRQAAGPAELDTASPAETSRAHK